MKNLSKTSALLILSSLLAFAPAAAQDTPFNGQAPDMPVDDNTKLITYSGVVDVGGTTKAELYKRAMGWFNAFYKNPTEVIREKDSVAMKIVGKPRFKLFNAPNEKGVKLDAGLVQYTISVGMKDGRFKYEITEINWKQPSYYGIEKWVEKKAQYVAFNYYLFSTDQEIKNVIQALTKAMKTAPKVVDKDNW